MNIIANLPYYIVSQVLFSLADSHRAVDTAVLTMQLEVRLIPTLSQSHFCQRCYCYPSLHLVTFSLSDRTYLPLLLNLNIFSIFLGDVASFILYPCPPYPTQTKRLICHLISFNLYLHHTLFCTGTGGSPNYSQAL